MKNLKSFQAVEFLFTKIELRIQSQVNHTNEHSWWFYWAKDVGLDEVTKPDLMFALS